MHPGDLFAGKYRVDATLGEGAMGTVLAATHLDLGRRVAIKVMKPEALIGPDAVERFLREARAAGRLQSEHVCKVHDVGRLDSGMPYIVMEYLDGEDLQCTLDRVGVLPSGDLARYVLDVCDALAEAHAIGIVHRDMKPQNLFRTRKPNSGATSMKILDFGVSKFRGDGANFVTAANLIVGTPSYMSPEQVSSSATVDGRTDIWALGVIMYQALVGAMPFDGVDVVSLAVAIATKPPARPPDPTILAPGLEAIILRCLEKDRARRFQSVGEVAAALAPFATAVVPWSNTLEDTGADHHLAPTMIASDIHSGPVGARVSTLGAAASHMERVPPRHRSAWWLPASAVTVVVLAILTAVSMRGGEATVSPAAATFSDDRQQPQPTGQADAASPALPAPAPVPAPPPIAAPNPATVAPVAPSSRAVEPASEVPVQAPLRKRSRSHGKRAVKTTPPPPDCAAPYVVDPNGKHIYKKECL